MPPARTPLCRASRARGRPGRSRPRAMARPTAGRSASELHKARSRSRGCNEQEHAMKAMRQAGRREFLKSSMTAAGLAWTARAISAQEAPAKPAGPPRIKFAAIGLDHGHITGQCRAVIRGGGELVSWYAKEDTDVVKSFMKSFPEVKRAKSEQEILDDKSIALVASAGIANERAPLGVRVMKAGKDYMSDKPAMTTLQQ